MGKEFSRFLGWGKKVKEKERMKTLGDALHQLSAASGAQFKDSPGNQKT